MAKPAVALTILSMLFGSGAVLMTPTDAVAECKIKCEKCIVNLKEGTAECTNCTLEDCQPG